MKRPALIFDFGNVVAHFDYLKAASSLGQSIGLSGEEVLNRLRPLGFSDQLKAYESGKMTAETFSSVVSEMLGLTVSHDDFVAAWIDIFQLNESLAPVLADLKSQGYTLVLGSNTNDLHAAHFRQQFAENLRHFDRLVLSYEVGHIKPSASFYLACAEAAQSPPEDCVFIDDLPENIEGARQAGLVGLLYRNTPELLSQLADLGIHHDRKETGG